MHLICIPSDGAAYAASIVFALSVSYFTTFAPVKAEAKRRS